MKALGDTRHHLRLLLQMGQVVEADLTQAFEAGQIDTETWASMVQACRGCADPTACAAWLADHAEAEAPMTGCSNTDLLMTLKSELTKD